MANLPESSIFDAGVTQWETTTVALGGASGAMNVPLLNLTNRTKYLKDHVDLMETIVPQAEAEAGIATTLRGWNALRVRQAVMAATGGMLSKSVAGGTTTTLTAAEAGYGILKLTGALTANKAVVVPASPTRSWIIKNETTGAYTLTVKTAAGTGVVCTQNTNAVVWTDGVNVYDALTDFDSINLTGNPTAPTAAKFDADTTIATTGFVQQALGSFSGIHDNILVNTTLTTADVNKWIFAEAPSLTLTLPLLSACPLGAVVPISANNQPGLSIVTQGADGIVLSDGTTETNIGMATVDTTVFVKVNEFAWYVMAGEYRLKLSSAFAHSLLQNGYQKLPSGLIVQWGIVLCSATAGAPVAVTLPIAFPNTPLAIVVGGYTPITTNAAVWTDTLTTTGFNIRAAVSTQASYFIALGY